MSEEQLIPRNNEQRRQRFKTLLDELQKRDLDGFLVPRADEHQGEYVPARAQRLAWLTGFTGSAGLALVYRHGSAIFVDGRYTLQVEEQVDTSLFAPQHLLERPPRQWLVENLRADSKIGFDAWLHTPKSLATMRTACESVGAELLACDENPVDAVWSDQPAPPLALVVPHALDYTGEEAAEKRERIAAQLTQDQLAAAVLTLPDSIAWLLNIRGSDVERSPLPLSFAILHNDAHVELFLDERKTNATLLEHLGNGVSLQSPGSFAARLQQLAGKQVKVDEATAADWIFTRLAQAGATVVAGPDPCLLPKACKNTVELSGTRSAHHRDGIALCQFFHWLHDNTPAGAVDEVSASDQLEQFRAASGELKDLSFDTISGAGANGAIVHYRFTEQSNKTLLPGTLYLVDSGAQYLDGTTDVTRTVAIGQPTAEQKDRFTRVLKGHIALATARFPKGTTGSQLDVLARASLWQAGLDFDHGTGHGVGSYLCVHEGPQRISKVASDIALKAGMIISNEPGYYKTGEYGIRIENLVVVTEAEDIAGGERPMMGFETLTMAPIDLALVDRALLIDTEREWLNHYHQWVWQQISPHLEGANKLWLEQATRSVD